jgi:glycine/D-amino acid oxidase-like deaminating enzyme
MPRPIDPFTSSPSLPARADVVIIGGGIAGISAALFLAQKGVSVAVAEKGVVGGEQSSRNWGFCRQQGRDPREIPLTIESLRLWRGMNETVGGETGFRPAGVLYLSHDEKSAAQRAEWLEYARPYQLDTRVVTGNELKDLLPGATRTWEHGLYTKSDGRAEPSKATSAIARAVQRLGGHVLQDCAARGLETSAGKVSAVITEKGRIACNAAVLAGGAWSRLFCDSLGITLPQLTFRSSVFRTGPVAKPPETSLYATGPQGFATRTRIDGGVTVAHGGMSDVDIGPEHFRFFFTFWKALHAEKSGFRLRFGKRFLEQLATPKRWALDQQSPFEKVRVLDPAPSDDLLDEAMANLRAAFPVFRDTQILDKWAGYIDATPDAVPVISAVESLPGFFISTGYSGHGFGIGPGAGRLMAELVMGAAPVVDPAPYRFSRFSDGSKIEAIAGV